MDAFRLELRGYVLTYSPGGRTLVVSFSPMKASTVVGERNVWGHDFLRKRGYSILGVVPLENDWYRGKDIAEFFLGEQFRGLCAAHDRRVFYGSSMGGYAACAFAAAAPGTIIVAHNPQTTLDTRIVPWERRFAQGRGQDWDGDFRDGRDGVAAAGRALVTFDPHTPEDAQHAERLQGLATFLLVPFVGHAVPGHLQRMGLLGRSFDDFVADTWDSTVWRGLVRRRRITRAFLSTVANRATTPWRAATIVRHAATALGGDRRAVLEIQCICAFKEGDGTALFERASALMAVGRVVSPAGRYWMVRALLMLGRPAEALQLAEQSLEDPLAAGRLIPLIVPLARAASDPERGDRMLSRVWAPQRAAWVDQLRAQLRATPRGQVAHSLPAAADRR